MVETLDSNRVWAQIPRVNLGGYTKWRPLWHSMKEGLPMDHRS